MSIPAATPTTPLYCLWPETGMVEARSEVTATLVRCGRMLISTSPLLVAGHPATHARWQQRVLHVATGIYSLPATAQWQFMTSITLDERWSALGWKAATNRGLREHAQRFRRLPGSSRRREDLLRLLSVAQLSLELAPDTAVQTLAKTCCLSPSRFHRVYARAFGATPRQMGNQFRLLHAMSLLAHTRLFTIEVAQACGYACRASLCRVINSELGVTPSEFREASSVDPGILWTLWANLSAHDGIAADAVSTWRTSPHRQLSRRLPTASATPR